MTSAVPPGRQTAPWAQGARRRADGLRHVRGVTRWTSVTAAGATLLLGLGYAHALPSLSDFGVHDPSGSGSGGNGTGNPGGSGSGGAQAPSLPGAGGGGAHTATGAS
ncbi:hypothetical protein [Streptacidiphilus sp. EB129]|uniref:hypothetical protein n=1 Tax=Streptacidiphilus sp. EB129 TaxID=3156262 RepID=UPI0035179CDA